MGHLHSFTETAAVHFRVEDDQKGRENGKEDLKDKGDDTRHLTPHSCNESCSDYSLHKGENHAEKLCRRRQESQMQEVEVAVHNQTCTDRIDQFQKASNKEHEACDISTEALQALYHIFHYQSIKVTDTVSSPSGPQPHGSFQKSCQAAAYNRFHHCSLYG